MGFRGIGRIWCNKTSNKGFLVVLMYVCFSDESYYLFSHRRRVVVQVCFLGCRDLWGMFVRGETRSFACAQDDKGGGLG